MTNQLRLAYYSPSAAKLYGSSFCRGADGSEIEVTGVEPSLESTGIYKWHDASSVSPVTEWIRNGQTGRNHIPDYKAWQRARNDREEAFAKLADPRFGIPWDDCRGVMFNSTSTSI